jgi:simple sugar transport system ATP-binding protein
MRHGSVVARLATAEADEDQLAELMVGRKVARRLARNVAARGAPLLEIARLALRDAAGRERLHDIGFTLHRGEILGIAGIAGNGQSELLQALAGLHPIAAGSVRLGGAELVADGRLPSPRRLRALGLAHAPEDRDGMGLVASFAAFESTLLGQQRDAALGRGPWLDRRRILGFCRLCLDSFAVSPADPTRATGLLSGGNRQKLVLARELAKDPDLLLVGQPSRGVDIGAIEFIHRRLLALRDSGKAILLVSADLDEVLALADRILVMAGGRITGALARDEADERRLGLMMAGIAA